MTQMVQLILASASPRRRELLDQIGVVYAVQPVQVDERPLPGETPERYVLRVTAAKAAAVKQVYDGDLPVLSADTAVVLDGHIMGKPESERQAVQMLSRLSGTTHQVYSAVSLWNDEHRQALNITEVSFRELSLSEIRAYWRTGEPADKAGAYAIQGLGSIFVRRISGSFSGVMGLPLFETAELLTRAGIQLMP